MTENKSVELIFEVILDMFYTFRLFKGVMLLIFLAPMGWGQDSLPNSKVGKIELYYQHNKGNDLPSKSVGSVSAGRLENGKLVPFFGNNFEYFDTSSYFAGRAFLHNKLLETILETYREFESLSPDRKFYVMECSNQTGGKMEPHHTHQNGLSIDFMTPLLKNQIPYSGLDSIGIKHYWLEFDSNGKLNEDLSVSIDFNLVAHHILILEQTARKYGLKIAKVIFKLELKELLFATDYGKKLAATSIYFAKNLPAEIDELHDDHYHIDFEFL